MRSLLPKGVLAATVLILLVVLVSSAVVLGRVRDERDAARTAAIEAQGRLAESDCRLGFFMRVNRSYQRSHRSQQELIRALRSQVGWDKDHLLDCRTAIVELLRTSTADSLVNIFGAEEAVNLTRSARTGRPLGYYIRRCASDAVP